MGEKRADRGDSGRSPNARSSSRRRGRPHRSVRRCGWRRRGRRAASRRRGTRRWSTWSASAVATSPPSQNRTPSTGWRWGQGGQGQGAREDRRGREGSTADNPVAGCGQKNGRQDRAAQRRRGTAARGREGKREGASDVDRQAARCRAGVLDYKKVVRAGIVGTVRKGKERDKRGSRKWDTGGGTPRSRQQEAQAAGRKGKGQGRRVSMDTWAHRCSEVRDWDGREVSSRQSSRLSSHHFHHHLTLRWG